MKKKGSWLWCFLLAIFLLAGCGTKEKEEKAEQTDVTEEAGKVQSERETDSTKPQGVKIRIYHSDDNAMNICVNTERTEEITPEILLYYLSFYGMLPEETTVWSLSETKEEGRRLLQLDLSEEFGTHVSSMGTSGEMMVVGSLVNTFLDAYEADGILVTVEGKVLESGHAVYDTYLEWYPYAEASYSIETREIREEGIQISYPQIQGLADTRIQEKWNAVIEGRIETSLDGCKDGSSYRESYVIKTMNDEILSILMEGAFREKGTEHSYSFQYTYNIDMMTGEAIRLAHYRDVEQIAENLMSGEGYVVDESVAEEFQDRLEILYGDARQLAASLKGYDYSEGSEMPYGYSYLEDGVTHLCMEIPHALGDYVDVALP